METLWWFRLKGTVIRNIWWQVLSMMVYAAVVVAVHNYVDEVNLDFGSTLIPVIGAVVSLLMGFRTNSAYARYWDGRTIWSQMTKHVRSLVITIWNNVNGDTSKDLIEKKSAINLCVSFVFATKHYLREEYSYKEEDMKDFIIHLRKFYTPSSNQPLDCQSLSKDEVTIPLRIRSASEGDLDLSIKPKGKKEAERQLKYKPFKLMAYEFPTPTNIPIEILCYLSSYINHVALEKTSESFGITMLNNSLHGLMDCLTSFERVLRTPIPLAYSIHLHHCVWLYLLSVPFQFVKSMSWGTIPIVGFGAFCMLGILSIAYEIENPFGYDANDLPLDDFCQVLKREVETITGNKPPKPDNWVFSSLNRPLKFATDCKLDATELVEKDPEEIFKILEDNARMHWVVLKRKK